MDEKKTLFECNLCPGSFNTIMNLENHLMNVHHMQDTSMDTVEVKDEIDISSVKQENALNDYTYIV